MSGERMTIESVDVVRDALTDALFMKARPDDVILIRLADDVSSADAERIHSLLGDVGCKVLIFAPDTEVVVCPGAAGLVTDGAE